ncbi:ABC transporter substrate-binding protein [Alteraurantiacibacter aestuarii]|uniref:ABC transporter substrate-binding protein n=1 Tax=Alteraurantiacibacter aestuarii TaxID=650004 RepID=UPI00301BCE52
MLAGLLLLALAGCQSAPKREQGDAPTVVSLNPCSDAILAEVAAPGQLLAISHYSHDPAATSMPLEQARRFAITGGTVEEVLALDPDVVVAGSFLPPASRAAFDRLGIQVETIGIASTLEDSLSQIRQLAALTGDAAAGEELVRQVETAWRQSAHYGPPMSTLMWQEGGIVPGPESLIARMLDHSGFALHSAARGLAQGAYLPLEAVLADPPALVLAASDERMLTHQVLGKMQGTAYRDFDPALLYCGGPTIIRALARLAQVRASI